MEVGEIKPDDIHLPGIFVSRIVQGEKYAKRIEKVTTRDPAGSAATEPVRL